MNVIVMEYYYPLLGQCARISYREYCQHQCTRHLLLWEQWICEINHPIQQVHHSSPFDVAFCSFHSIAASRWPWLWPRWLDRSGSSRRRSWWTRTTMAPGISTQRITGPMWASTRNRVFGCCAPNSMVRPPTSHRTWPTNKIYLMSTKYWTAIKFVLRFRY